MNRMLIFALISVGLLLPVTVQAGPPAGPSPFADEYRADPAKDVFYKDGAAKLIEKEGVEKLIFIKRATFQSSHYYTDYIDGCKFFGCDICTLDLKTGKVESILPESMRGGIISRFDLSFDATKVCFDWKADENSGFHIWEINVDGTDVHQVTRPPADDQKISEKYHLFKEEPWHWIGWPFRYTVDFGIYGHWADDMHPCYLPDGGIAFISTRCRYGILCDGPDVLTTTVLYRVNPDGTDLKKLSNSSVSEANPSISEDGRILYTRWEYIDKGGSCVKCIWSMRIDGTASAEVYGNDLAMPPSILHVRQVPGASTLYVATNAPHCPNTGVGGLMIIDSNKNIRTEEAMELITPETTTLGEGWFKHPWMDEEPDAEKRKMMKACGPHFADPYPFDTTTMLMACQPSREKLWLQPDGYGIYLYEGPGKYTPVYDAGGTSCWMPQPLRARKRPPVRLSPIDNQIAEKKIRDLPMAVCVVTDVYHGLDGIDRGEVKYIRVNEQVPRPWAARRTWHDVWTDNYDQQHAAIGATNLGLRVQWGIVPVEEDGSAHFYVPADRNIFLQVLDEDYQELQRERTFVNYRPGETRACIGCHETPNDAPTRPALKQPMALLRSPSMPGPQPGEETGQRTFEYVRDIQPIMDKHCVSCHDGKNDETELDLRGELTRVFSISYENLIGFKCSRDDTYSVKRQDLVGKLIREIRPKVGNAEYLPPRSLGSTTSSLVTLLREGHYKVKLSEEEMVRITTWIDANCQYYGSYWGRKDIKDKDHPNFRRQATFLEAIDTECSIPDEER